LIIQYTPLLPSGERRSAAGRGTHDERGRISGRVEREGRRLRGPV